LNTLTAQCWVETVTVAPRFSRPRPAQTRVLDVRYLGATKDEAAKRAALLDGRRLECGVPERVLFLLFWYRCATK
jgi:hypothetical protein